MRFALMVEPQQGITWPRQVAIAAARRGGGLRDAVPLGPLRAVPGPRVDDRRTRSGHRRAGARDGTLRHGTLVSPVTFRHPGNVAKMVSQPRRDERRAHRAGARAPAGTRRSTAPRFAFPDIPTRLEMLEEQLQVVGRALGGTPGWAFEGPTTRSPRRRTARRPRHSRGRRSSSGTKGRPRDPDGGAATPTTSTSTTDAREDPPGVPLLDRRVRAIGRDPGARDALGAPRHGRR